MDIRHCADAAALFEKVTKIYQCGWPSRRVVALDEVSLAVRRGEVLGLIGPNRAGKTTLVKILLSICRPTEGRIMRLGCPWSDRRTLAAVGYVHENPAFPRYLSAWQIVEGYGRLSGVAGSVLRRRAGTLIEQVGLADRAHEKIAGYSKGMLQRLALAQALVNDPQLLVLDEPSEGMDLSARRLLRDVICQQRDRGQTVILVSHALSDVQRLSDRVAVLREGRLAYVGPLDELTADDDSNSLEEAVEPLYEGATS
jgi:ABC-2 type transport system ATP-binding protein